MHKILSIKLSKHLQIRIIELTANFDFTSPCSQVPTLYRPNSNTITSGKNLDRHQSSWIHCARNETLTRNSLRVGILIIAIFQHLEPGLSFSLFLSLSHTHTQTKNFFLSSSFHFWTVLMIIKSFLMHSRYWLHFLS